MFRGSETWVQNAKKSSAGQMGGEETKGAARKTLEEGAAEDTKNYGRN